jgi:hypothetical protein
MKNEALEELKAYLEGIVDYYEKQKLNTYEKGVIDGLKMALEKIEKIEKEQK